MSQITDSGRCRIGCHRRIHPLSLSLLLRLVIIVFHRELFAIDASQIKHVQALDLLHMFSLTYLSIAYGLQAFETQPHAHFVNRNAGLETNWGRVGVRS